MIAIPAIDIMNGACVRLRQGRFDQRTTYEADPLHTAKAIEAAGIGYLHLVDLDGARTGNPANLHILEKLAGETSLQIDFGGGVRDLETIRRVLKAGAFRVNLGTFLFSGPGIAQQCTETFGRDALIAAADISQGKVAVKGWQQRSQMEAAESIDALMKAGWLYISVTDIGRDGTMEGPDPDFYKPLVDRYPEARFIGGGGVASMADLHLLESCGLYGAVTGKAIFEGKISLEALSGFNKKHGNPRLKKDYKP